MVAYMYRRAPTCATFHLISNFVLSRLGLLAYCDPPSSHRQHVLDEAWTDPLVAIHYATALSHRLLSALLNGEAPLLVPHTSLVLQLQEHDA